MPRYEVKHRSLLTILLVLPSLIVLGTRLILGTSLPSITATHWSGNLHPDGFTDTRVFVSVCVSLTVAGALLGFLAIGLAQKPALHSGLLFIAGLAAWTSAGVFVTCAVPSALAGDPTQAVNSALFVILSIIASLLGLVPVWISGIFQQFTKESQDKRRQRVAQAQGNAAAVPAQKSTVSPLEQFNQTASASWWFWLLGFFPLVLGVLMLTVLKGDDQSESLILRITGPIFVLLLTPLVLGLCKIRVRIAEDRVRVSSAIFGFPLRSIAVNQIKDVRSEVVLPMAWGGWGWRFFPGGSAVVLRQGDGLTFELHNGKRFAVTISEAPRAVAILQAKMSQA